MAEQGASESAESILAEKSKGDNTNNINDNDKFENENGNENENENEKSAGQPTVQAVLATSLVAEGQQVAIVTGHKVVPAIASPVQTADRK